MTTASLLLNNNLDVITHAEVGTAVCEGFAAGARFPVDVTISTQTENTVTPNIRKLIKQYVIVVKSSQEHHFFTLYHTCAF